MDLKFMGECLKEFTKKSVHGSQQKKSFGITDKLLGEISVVLRGWNTWGIALGDRLRTISGFFSPLIKSTTVVLRTFFANRPYFLICILCDSYEDTIFPGKSRKCPTPIDPNPIRPMRFKPTTLKLFFC